MTKRNLVLASVSGLLLAAALPRPGIWAASWIGLAPLFLALRGARLPSAALYGLVTGLVYYGIIFFWMCEFGYLPWVITVVGSSAFLAAFTAASCRFAGGGRSWFAHLAIPAAWTTMQWLRSLGIFAFNWGSFAHTQAGNLPIAQMSSITGPWGIDFLVCMANVAVAEVAFRGSDRRRLRPAAAALGVAGIVAGAGYLALLTAPDYRPETSVTIIQGNVIRNLDTSDENVLNSYHTYRDMTQMAALDKPDFIVWPETTLPVNVTDTGVGRNLSRIARQADTNLVVGAYDPPGDRRVEENYNSAFFYDRNGRKLGVYHKVLLVPFGEYVPWKKELPWLANFSLRDVQVLPGAGYGAVQTEIGRIGTPICYESFFPWPARVMTLNGASALFVITNDSWFKQTQAARHHLVLSQLRAIETRRYVVRAAATGISAIIDPYGRITTERGYYEQGVVTGKIAPLHALTPYVRAGDWLAYVCAAATLVSLMVSRRDKAR